MSHLAVMVSLNQHPLGSMSGENFTVPSNYRIPPARIYVVNHSLKRKWKRPLITVSTRRGAEEVLTFDDGAPRGQRLRDVYTADMLYKQVEQGRDMNKYKEEIKPVVWKLRIPGAVYEPVKVTDIDGKEHEQMQFAGERFKLIPPSDPKDPDREIWVEVPESTWDLYLGNYNRMRGFPGVKPRDTERFDRRIQMTEEQALAQRWSGKHRPIFAFRDDESGTEKVTDLGNPHGVLEIVRVTQKSMSEPISKEYLQALDLFESN
jgi:hypothetical protein